MIRWQLITVVFIFPVFSGFQHGAGQQVESVIPTLIEAERPQDVDSVESSTVTLKCNVSGSPPHQIKWIRNNVELTGGRFTTLPSGDLQIKYVGFGDGGKYRCLAVNEKEQINATISLTVWQRTQIKSGTSSVNRKVVAGSPVILRCNAQTADSLELSIQWLKNGEQIDLVSEPRYVQANDNSLIITKANKSDTSVYTCVASTRLDNATVETNLVVQDVPDPPKLVDITCDLKAVTLQWQSKNNNLTPILSYEIQYNTCFTPDNWYVTVDSVPVFETKYTVPLTPGAIFSFRILAKNEVGLSLPSQYSSVCKTEYDVPYKNPDNVSAQGTKPTNLVISWTPMSQIEHHAPGFYYTVLWRRNVPYAAWENQTITNWKQNNLVVDDVPIFVEYEVKVLAGNERGQAIVSADSVIGYSGEDTPTESPKNVTLLEILSATSANISWLGVRKESVRGHFQGYKIQIWTDVFDSTKTKLKEIDVHYNVSHYVVHKLTPYTKNVIRVLVFNGKHNGPPSEDLEIQTSEGVPDPVQTLKTIPLGTFAFLLMWKPPLNANGVLTGYKILYQTIRGTTLGVTQFRKQITDPNQTQTKLDNLKQATRYRISISAMTSTGEGEWYVTDSTTGSMGHISPPSKPDFELQVVNTNIVIVVKILWLPCGKERDCRNKSAGSHFFVKYKSKRELTYKTEEERNEDFILIRGLLPNESYLFIVCSVDGEYSTESDPREFKIEPAGTTLAIALFADIMSTNKTLSAGTNKILSTGSMR